MLEIKDLHVSVSGKEIVKGISLNFEPGKIYVLMGKNGSGKSTLANTLMGHPLYKITNGKITLDGKDLTAEKADVRSRAGLFLCGFQQLWSVRHDHLLGLSMQQHAVVP